MNPWEQDWSAPQQPSSDAAPWEQDWTGAAPAEPAAPPTEDPSYASRVGTAAGLGLQNVAAGAKYGLEQTAATPVAMGAGLLDFATNMGELISPIGIAKSLFAGQPAAGAEPQDFLTAVQQGANKIFGAFADAPVTQAIQGVAPGALEFGLPGAQAYADETRAAIQQTNERLAANKAAGGGGFGLDVATGLAQMAPAVGVGLATRSPAAAAATLAAPMFGQTLAEGEGDVAQRAQRAAAFTGAEFVTELPVGKLLTLPASALVRELGKNGVAQVMGRIAKTAGAEGLQEASTNVLQDLYDNGALDENKSIGDIIADAGYAGAVGALAGSVAGAPAAVAEARQSGKATQADAQAREAYKATLKEVDAGDGTTTFVDSAGTPVGDTLDEVNASVAALPLETIAQRMQAPPVTPEQEAQRLAPVEQAKPGVSQLPEGYFEPAASTAAGELQAPDTNAPALQPPQVNEPRGEAAANAVAQSLEELVAPDTQAPAMLPQAKPSPMLKGKKKTAPAVTEKQIAAAATAPLGDVTTPEDINAPARNSEAGRPGSAGDVSTVRADGESVGSVGGSADSGRVRGVPGAGGAVVGQAAGSGPAVATLDARNKPDDSLTQETQNAQEVRSDAGQVRQDDAAQGRQVKGGGNLQRTAEAGTEARDTQEQVAPRILYRGTTGSQERIKGGIVEGALFAAADENTAKLYGGNIERIALKPDARILLEGTPEFAKVTGRRRGKLINTMRQGENLKTASDDAAAKAKAAGYDGVEFTSMKDLGIAIFNEGAVTRNYTEQVTEQVTPAASKKAAEIPNKLPVSSAETKPKGAEQVGDEAAEFAGPTPTATPSATPTAPTAKPVPAGAAGLTERLRRTGVDVPDGAYTDARLPGYAGEAVDAMATLFKKRVVVFRAGENAPKKSGGLLFPADPGTIYLNADANVHPAVVFMHELVHSMKRTDAKTYAALEKALLPMLRNREGYVKTRLGGKDLGALTEEEMIADIMADHASDPKFWSDLYGRFDDKSAWQQFSDYIRRLLSNVIDVLYPVGAYRYIDDFNAAYEHVVDAAYNHARAQHGDAPSSDGSALEMMAGVAAKGANSEALNAAKQMENSGASSREIWDATGWHRGKDRKWRFEIPDTGAKFKKDFAEMEESALFKPAAKVKLGDLLDHPKLFEAYPEAANIEVVKRKGFLDFGGLQGWFDGKNDIGITPYAQHPLSTLLHEVQHWIQTQEGFAQGGNEDSVFAALSDEQKAELAKKLLDAQAKKAEQAIKDIDGVNKLFEAHGSKRQALKDGDYRERVAFSDAVIAELGVSKDIASSFLYGDRSQEELVAAAQRAASEAAKTVAAIKSGDEKAIAKLLSASGEMFTFYKALAGEVEARNVQKRREMSLEELLRTSPENTEDVDRGTQIVIMADEIAPASAREEGPMESRPILSSAQGSPPSKSLLDEGNAYWRAGAKMWDNLNRVRILQEKAVAKGVTLTDKMNVWVKENLSRSKMRVMADKVTEDYQQPILDIMAKNGLSLKQVDDYLYALHAPERNAAIAKINPKFPDNGSGMSDKEAAQTLASFTPKQTTALKDIAAKVSGLQAYKLSVMEQYGLMEAADVQRLKSMYNHYIPLKTIDEGDTQPGQTGRGLDIRGSEVKQALGRGSRATSPLMVSFQDMARTLVRTHKNEAGNALLELARDPLIGALQQNGKPVIAIANPADFMQQTTDAQGNVKMAVPSNWWQSEEIFVTKDKGVPSYVHVRDPELMAQLRRMGDADMGPAVRAIGSATRMFARMLTQYNPVFAPVNVVRDAIQASVLSLGVPGLNPLKVMKGILPNLGRIMAHGARPNQRYKEFLEDGASTNAYGLNDLQDSVADLEALGISLGYAQPSKGAFADAMAKIGAARRSLARKKAVSTVFDGLTWWNEAFENAVRLSTYNAMRDAGLTRDQAAFQSKELSTNFNKKGELSSTLNAVYIFVNAAMQGNRALVRFWKESPRVRAAALGLVAAGVLQDILGAAFGGEDEESGLSNLDEVGDWALDHNIVLPTGPNKQVKIPIPYGLNLPFVMGRRVSKAIRTGDAFQIVGILNVALDNFSPIGGFEPVVDAKTGQTNITATSIKTLLPSLLRPTAGVAFNSNFMGAPIAREPFQGDRSPPPRASDFKPGTADYAVTLSKWLNEVSGGNVAKPGDVNISPEHVQYLIGEYAGGAGRFVSDVTDISTKLARGATGDIEWAKAPFVRSFTGTDSRSDAYARYRDISTNVAYLKDEKKAKVASDPAVKRIAPAVARAEDKLADLRKQRKAAYAREDMATVRRIQDQETAIIKGVVKQWNAQQKGAGD